MHIIAEQSDRSTIERVQTEAERWRPTFWYLSQTEVHVYALSIGASALLSFFPFLIVMLTLVRDIFHFPAAEQALTLALGDYFPGDLGSFIIRNLTKVNHGRFQITSLVLLLFTANGIFEPLEVALNRAWHVTHYRSYVMNLILSLFLFLLCGGLSLGSVLADGDEYEVGGSSIWVPGDSGLAFAGDLQSGRDPDHDSFLVPRLLAAAELPGTGAARVIGGDSGRLRA